MSALAETIQMLERTINKQRIEIKHLFGADSDICGRPLTTSRTRFSISGRARDAMTAGGCLLVETENVAIDAAFIPGTAEKFNQDCISRSA